ncbi:PEF-CTERM sorting domain-containing protein [Methanococcoides alaskense]|uniref:PEF-CTERM protein sorting domain-containing protein n=1 Tax=Methanococcoides alaskense TaxID=325778 RepID=A0AA90Z7P1_9EURY|nr:PEF-CTERM sorting domain-containing protein [Methanococcoides alaskense]MDR6222740.1 hypothetical protein [Methanococcoides alaskense]
MIRKSLLWVGLVVLLVAMTGIAVAAPPDISSPVEWTGQGTDSTEDCTDLNFNGAPGIHWIATGANGATDYVLTIYDKSSGDVLDTATGEVTGGAIHFYTVYHDFDDLEATLTFTGTMKHNAKVVISHYCSGEQEIPEFPTVALPIAAILGLSFIFMRRKE